MYKPVNFSYGNIPHLSKTQVMTWGGANNYTIPEIYDVLAILGEDVKLIKSSSIYTCMSCGKHKTKRLRTNISQECTNELEKLFTFVRTNPGNRDYTNE